MVRISVPLILRTHFPTRDRSSVSEDEILTLTKIDLSGHQIDEIDNLEVFSDIKELRLRNNNICRVENVYFLSQLEILDVANNDIKFLTDVPTGISFV
jgi:Leucine-rich repeat (LRR) protein